MVKIDLSAALTGLSTGFAIGGVVGALDRSSRAKVDVEDRTPEFKAQVRKVLDEERLEARVLEAVDSALRPGARCEFVVFRSAERGSEQVGPADDVFLAGIDLLFGGKPPAMIVRMSWFHIKDATALSGYEAAATECRRFAEEARGKRMGLSEARKALKVCRKMTTFVDAYDRVRLDVPSKSREEWLSGDGAVLRREVVRALNQTASEMATRFYGKAPVR